MLENLLWLCLGIVITTLFNYILSIGWSIIILRQAQTSCAALFIQGAQGLEEILELKYITMKEADRSEQNIIAQRYIDQTNIDSLKATIMRNYVRTWPSSYAHVMDFKTWPELENFINNAIKKTRRGYEQKQ